MKISFLGKHLSIVSKFELYSLIAEWVKKGESKSVFFANVHMVVEAKTNSVFGYVFDNADVVVPDGMPLVFALKYLYNIEQERIAGMDYMHDILALAQAENAKVFFYGSTNEVLEKTVARCNLEYPELKIAGYHSPPYRELSEIEKIEVINLINSSGAKLLMVALGCPKQEKWISQMKGSINAVMFGLGGAFPIFANIQRRSPLWMQRSGLEWLFRLFQEPKRLWRRYLITNTKYILFLFFEFVKKSAS